MSRRASLSVALLRGVNVGRASRVPMASLRTLLASLGYTDVRTLLNSGNAVFGASGGASAGHARRIRAALSAQLGVDVLVVVKSAREMATVVAGNRLASITADASRLLVAFASGSGAARQRGCDMHDAQLGHGAEDRRLAARRRAPRRCPVTATSRASSGLLR